MGDKGAKGKQVRKKTLLSLPAVMALLEKNFQPSKKNPLPRIVKKNIASAVGMICAEAVKAKNAVPHFTNSAVDGFAFRFQDIIKTQNGEARTILTIAGVIPAAPQKKLPTLARQQTMQIFTGAPLPMNADTVIMQEDVVIKNDHIILPENLNAKFTRGDNVRKKGDDVASGQPLLKQGEIITALHVGLLAAQNITMVKCFAPLRVGVFSSGNEIKSNGLLRVGEIFDSNRPMILSLLHHWRYEVVDGGTLPDQENIMTKKLSAMAKKVDVILTTGGMAVGGHDVAAPLIKKSNMQFYGVAIKPGRPLGFGQVGGKPWIAMPGNPVAVMMGLFFIIKPFLNLRQGRKASSTHSTTTPIILPSPISAIAHFSMKKKPGRCELVRVKLQMQNNTWLATKIAKSGSAVLSSLVEADAIAAIDDDVSIVNPGDSLRCYQMKELLNP